MQNRLGGAVSSTASVCRVAPRHRDGFFRREKIEVGDGTLVALIGKLLKNNKSLTRLA
jgi:hypothetical protein